MRSIAKTHIAASLMAVLGGISQAAISQDQEGARLEEIIVTSRRVEENVQRAPVTVSTLTGSALEQAFVNNLAEISSLAPNVSISAGNNFANTIVPFVRGVGTNDIDAIFDPAIAVVIDGIYLSRTMGAVPDLYDVERLEVLRGPQGTVFGRNSLAGALNIVTKRPTGENSFKAQTTIGEYGQRDFSGRLDFAMTDTLAGKISLQRVYNDGYRDITVAPDLSTLSIFTGGAATTYGVQDMRTGTYSNETDNITVRPTVTYRNGDDVEISLIGEYSKFEYQPGTGNGAVPGAYTASFGAWPTPLVALFSPTTNDPNNLNEDVLDISLNVFGEQTTEVRGLYLESITGLGEGELTINTGYRWFDTEIYFDTDGSLFDSFSVLRPEESNQFTFEARYNGNITDQLSYVAGAFYLDDSYEQKTQAFGALVAAGQLGAGLPLPVSGDSFDYTSQDRSSWAIYTTLDWQINDKWRATVGARYSYEEKDVVRGLACSNLEYSVADCLLAVARDDDWNSFSPKFTIDYQINEDTFIYGIVATAARSGGINGRSASLVGVTSFDEEEVISYEAGVKSEFFDNRIRLNVAAFQNDYSDLQREVLDGLSAGSTSTFNVADGTIRGVEIELTALPFDSLPGLTIISSVGLLDTEYDSYTADILPGVPGEEDLSNSEFRRAPDMTFNMRLNYEQPVYSGSMLAYASYTWTDEAFHHDANITSFVQDSYEELDLSLGYRAELANGHTFGITIFGKNLTNDFTYLNGSHVFGVSQPVEPSLPRRYGVRFEYEY